MITWLGLPVQIAHAEVDETPRPGEAPADLAVRLARAKALAARPATSTPHTLLLAADTTVDLRGESLGKPETPEEARAMLRALQNGPHQVHTGVALYAPHTATLTLRRVTTEVVMRAYSEAEIAAYIASGDPMDKAGGYAVQHPGFQPVAQLERCYANVVGLPLCAVVALLRAWNYADIAPIPTLCRRHFGYTCPAVDTGIAL